MKIDKNKVIDQGPFLLALGINRIQGYEPISFYLNSEILGHSALSFKTCPHNSSKVEIEYHSSDQKWSGMPFVLQTEGDQIDLQPWIKSYAPLILKEAYLFFTDDEDQENEKEDEEVTVQMSYLKDGSPEGSLIMAGYLKEGPLENQSKRSVDFRIVLYPLPKEPMESRRGDRRIGYFYSNLQYDLENKISGDPIVTIHRKNLEEAKGRTEKKASSWTYVIDSETIPEKYHVPIRKGILSWNNYFEHLGLGRPLQVIQPEGKVDIFDPKYSYIVGTHAKQFNGPYSGYSIYLTDYRSGEILFGMVSLNLIKIETIPVRASFLNKLEIQMDDYLSWVTAHEIGHQLGLRHNFMGNLTSKGFGSIMDYIDIFNSVDYLSFLDIEAVDRDYDLKAIEYGYSPSGKLDQIASKGPYYFATDENYFEGINPYVGRSQNQVDLLRYIGHMIQLYRTQRSNLLKEVSSGRISAFDYQTMFLYLYAQKYYQLIKLCLKFIGGRAYGPNRSEYRDIPSEQVEQAVEFLLQLLKEIQYNSEEYNRMIYPIKEQITDFQLMGRIDATQYYALNDYNLFYIYHKMVETILHGITDIDSLIRLSQSSVTLDPVKLLAKVTIGIFPELDWQKNLTEDPLQQSIQFQWVSHLCNIRQDNKLDYYPLQKAVYTVLNQLKKFLEKQVLPYRPTQHWQILVYLINQPIIRENLLPNSRTGTGQNNSLNLITSDQS